MPESAHIQALFAAFEALTDAELLAIRKAASIHMRGTSFSEPADLIHEALTRCLDGRRHWPQSVPFPVFLGNVMRSVGSADRKLCASRLVVSNSHFEPMPDSDLIEAFGGASPSAEEDCILIERALLLEAQSQRLREAFRADHAASAIMSGWGAELTANEIMALHDLSLKEYDAARKRIQRWAASPTHKRSCH